MKVGDLEEDDILELSKKVAAELGVSVEDAMLLIYDAAGNDDLLLEKEVDLPTVSSQDINSDGDPDVTSIDQNGDGETDVVITTADSKKEDKQAVASAKDELGDDKTSTGKDKDELDDDTTLSDGNYKNIVRALYECRY